MLEIDRATDRLRIRCSGIYDRREIEAHVVALRTALDRRRARGAPIRVLVDLSAASVQPPEVAAMMADRMRAVYEPGDRVAVWSPSVLHGMQVRRLNPDDRRFVTASLEEAERFLGGGVDELPWPTRLD